MSGLVSTPASYRPGLPVEVVATGAEGWLPRVNPEREKARLCAASALTGRLPAIEGMGVAAAEGLSISTRSSIFPVIRTNSHG